MSATDKALPWQSTGGIEAYWDGEAGAPEGDKWVHGDVFWIDPRDEYPDADMTVLVAIVESDTPVWLGFTDGSEWFDACTGEQFAGRVTHWAELPASPKPEAAG